MRKLQMSLLVSVAAGASFGQTPVGILNPVPPCAPPASIYRPDFVPMTQGERFHNYVKSTFSPGRIAASAFAAGINQWRDNPEEWEQGGSGYGKRFLNAYSRSVLRQTMTYGLSSALHEDNRYFRQGEGSVGSRLKYALQSTALAREDDGTRHVSISRIGGTAGAAFVSTLWQPPSDRSVDDAWHGFAISMGTQAAFNVVREFLPRKLGRLGGNYKSTGSDRE